MFTYVVLHYLSSEMTIDCVNRILNLSNDSRIVIVDNCSPNNSGKELLAIYGNNSRVHIILNSQNEGFARGNNRGYAYAREFFDSDYVVVSNNDILIEQLNFEQIISSFMEQNNIDVCGPDIITPDGFHQNPLRLEAIPIKVLRKTIYLNKIKLLLFSVPVLFKWYANYRKKHKVIVGTSKKPQNIMNCVLHGSFIVFNRRYVLNESHAFLPVTYMYGEEFILYDYLKSRGYKTGVCATAEILHLGGKSTTSQWGDIGKTRFRFKNTTDSLCILLKLRLKYKKDGINYEK